MQPKIHIRYSPGRGGFVSALFYVELEADLYGWYAEAREHRFYAAYFMLENFYAPRTPLLYRSAEDDVYGPWLAESARSGNEIRCPLPEPVRHELERIQSKFVQDWLFFENDPAALTELETYSERRLAPQAVNVRSRKLHRLDKRNETLWEHSTPGCDSNIMDFLSKHWPTGERAIARAHAAEQAAR